MLKGLNQPHIRLEKPGYADAYYDLAENLEAYLDMLLSSLKLAPQQIQGGPGETGVNLKLTMDGAPLMLRLNIWEGELYASNVFYERARAAGIPTPQVVHFDGSHAVIPYDTQIVTFLPGHDLDHIPDHLHAKAGALMGRALRQIHALPVEGFGAPLPDGRWSNQTWLTALHEFYGAGMSLATKQKLYSDQQIERIEQLTFQNERLILNTPSLIHGDVGRGNGLFEVHGDSLTLTGVIDPGSMIAGDPMFDLMVTEDDFGLGLQSAYTNILSLSIREQMRHAFLKLLVSYWLSCWQFDTERDFAIAQAQTLALMRELH